MLTKIIRSFKFFLSYISVLTMVLTPVAQGAQSESVPKETLEKMLGEIGLNRQITVGEFFKKNKHLFTDGIRKQVEPMMDKFKDQIMPTFEIIMLQNPNGQKTPVIRVTDQGQLYSIQMFSDENKAVKFDNTELDAQEVVNFNLMIEKLYYHEPRLRKIVGGSDKLSSVKIQQSKPFAGLPAINPKVWETYSVKEKTQYIYNLRKLWTQSNAVLESVEQTKKTKKNSKTSLFSFLLTDSVAGPTPRKDKPMPGSSKSGQAGKTKMSARDNTDNIEVTDDNTCVIAGYISMYRNGKCSADMSVIRKKYNIAEGQNPKMDAAIKYCEAKGQMACNSFIYGLDNSGNGICIPKTGDDFQKATHASGPCEKASPLGPDVSFLVNENLKNEDRYSEANLKIKDLEGYYRDQVSKDANYQSNIERFLMSMTVSDGKNVNFNEALSLDVVKQLQLVQDEFNKNITNARDACKAAAKNKQYDKNFWGACDQLQRRFLFVREFLKNKPGCPDKQAPKENFMCACPNGAEDVTPGSKCSDKPAVPAPTDQNRPDSENKPEDQGQCNPACNKENEICKNLNTANYTGRDKWQCIPNTIGGGSSGSSNSALMDGLLKVGKWLLIGAGVYVGFKYVLPLLFPKKPKLNAAADPCANGSIPACGRVCPTGQALLSSGICGCQGCPPGTSITSSVNCACSTTLVAPTQLTCPDGLTIKTNLSDCPVKCPDGSYALNVNSCPNVLSTVPTSSKPSTSSTGQ